MAPCTKMKSATSYRKSSSWNKHCTPCCLERCRMSSYVVHEPKLLKQPHQSASTVYHWQSNRFQPCALRTVGFKHAYFMACAVSTSWMLCKTWVSYRARRRRFRYPCSVLQKVISAHVRDVLHAYRSSHHIVKRATLSGSQFIANF